MTPDIASEALEVLTESAWERGTSSDSLKVAPDYRRDSGAKLGWRGPLLVGLLLVICGIVGARIYNPWLVALVCWRTNTQLC